MKLENWLELFKSHKISKEDFMAFYDWCIDNCPKYKGVAYLILKNIIKIWVNKANDFAFLTMENHFYLNCYIDKLYIENKNKEVYLSYERKEEFCLYSPNLNLLFDIIAKAIEMFNIVHKY